MPSLYEVPEGGRTPRPKVTAPENTPFPVVARKVPVLGTEDHPREMVVSLTETTHDRLPIEVMRGCVRGCRFCQAGYLYRPTRERDVDETVEIARAGIEQSSYSARFPHPPFNTTLGTLTEASAVFLAAASVVVTREGKRRRRDIDIRPLVHEFAVVAEDEVVLRLTTASGQAVRPTEILRAALDLDEGLVPLIQVHKFEATLASGDHPAAGALARAEVTSFEARNTYFSHEPARDACGDTGGWSPC